MNNITEGVKNTMFAHAEDPQKSQWWNVAWETLHNADFGPVISKKTSPIEEALWLLELRNIHSVYECVFYDGSYDPMWIDWWETTGIAEDKLTAFLETTGDFEQGTSLQDAIHTYCWGKRQTIFDTLMKKYEDESALFMLFVGGKIPRSRDRAQAVYDWVSQGFGY